MLHLQIIHVCISSQSFLISYRFSQCLVLFFFSSRGLECWVFMLKLPLASISQNKNLMPETFCRRHWQTEIIPHYRFPRRVIHGKYNAFPMLPITYFLKIQINAVRTTNKLFFQNVRGAIFPHYTISLSKEWKRICFSKESALLYDFLFCSLISYVSMGKLCKSDLYSSLKLCFVAVKSKEGMTDWSIEEQVGTEQNLLISFSTWWHSCAFNTRQELFLWRVKLTLNKT